VVGADGQLPLPWIAPWLDRALQGGRGHAVLIHGPRGVGQWELAMALAQAWLCESPQGGRPCGRCAACRLVQARSHPDLLVLLPEAIQQALGWGGNDASGEGGEAGAKGRQPSKDIRVDAVRGAVTFAQTTPARGVAKVVVVHPAERMNAIAANALLKTLEEPAGAARFVLGSAAPDSLLPTIRSRCLSMALTLPPREAAIGWLQSQGVPDADVLLDAAGGQPLDALDWSRDGLDAARWRGLPMQVARGDATVLAGWTLPRAVDALLKLCHDAWSCAVGAPPRYFPRDALPSTVSARELPGWHKALQRAARHAEHPLNAALQVESLVTQGQRALVHSRA